MDTLQETEIRARAHWRIFFLGQALGKEEKLSMVSARLTDDPTKIPERFTAIPIHGVGNDVPLRLCVLVRNKPDPVGGRRPIIQK